MQILHLDLKITGEDVAELRYFADNPNQYESRRLHLKEIDALIRFAEETYYVRLAEDYTATGRRLYEWLDGSDRWLERTLNQYPGEDLVLAFSVVGNLAHLPWEILHDGISFFVERRPSIVPIRWIPNAQKQLLADKATPENRALNVLFMATSPLAIEPILDFEAEEGRILEATAEQPLGLTVEESGCLTELSNLVSSYSKGYFDVFHLTGHASLGNGQSFFITEGETGEPVQSSAKEIAKAFGSRLPKLIFLSGCRTGQASESGAVPSMAEDLLKEGMRAVLSWGEKVLDTDAAAAAAALYQALSRGDELTEAISYTYKALIENKARDWHLLRLYVTGVLPGQLVTTADEDRRKPAPLQSVATQFLDSRGKVKVPTRQNFVGRRRQLQNCLRALKSTSETLGVLIHGMGGFGKSSLAARLCDRLSKFERVVWVGVIDEPTLVKHLSEKLENRELCKVLQTQDDLKFRLKHVFNRLLEEGRKPFLLVLDDFEQNLEMRTSGFVLKPDVAAVLDALIQAIQERNTTKSHRIVITCRYDFEFTQLQYFYKQPLNALRGADLRKKCERLSAFCYQSQVDEAQRARAIRLADGVPRLLEWLNKILLDSTVDPVTILSRLEADPAELRERVLADSLLKQMNQSTQEMLLRGLVFELPVPREAISQICADLPHLSALIDHAIALGLLEVSINGYLRVPRIIPLKLQNPSQDLYINATRAIYRLWWMPSTITEEQCLEIHRLALISKLEELTVSIAKYLATKWNEQERYREVRQLCQSTLSISNDYRIYSEIGLAELVLGNTEVASCHYQKALTQCNPEDKFERSEILASLSELCRVQGKKEEALSHCQLALEIKDEISDSKGKAEVLNNLSNRLVVE